MSVVSYRLAAIGLACALVTPASAQLLARKDLSAAMAVSRQDEAQRCASYHPPQYAAHASMISRRCSISVSRR
jgi:hypothetical protein